MPQHAEPPIDLHLEPLEARILLSADPLQAMALIQDRSATDLTSFPATEIILQDDAVAAALNAPAPATSHAIADEASLCQQLEAGLAALRATLPDFARRFDLHTLNIPALPHALDQFFNLSGQIAPHALTLLPDIGSSSTLEQMVDRLVASGYEVIGVQGGLPDRQIAATTNGSLIEVRYHRGAGVKFSPSGAYSGTSFNNDTEALLQGLGSTHNLTADWSADTGATVYLDVVFGVDATGFFIRSDQFNLTAAVNGGATLGGSSTLSGTANVALTGSARVDLEARLGFETTASLRTSELATQIATATLTEAWSGTADLQIGFAIGSTNLTFGAAYTGSFTGAPSATVGLSGTIRLPGVVDAASGDPALLDIDGAWNVSARRWELTAHPHANQSLRFHDVELRDFAIALTLTEHSYAGTTSGTLRFDAIHSSSAPLALDFTASLTDSGYAIATSVDVSSLSVFERSDVAAANGTEPAEILALSGIHVSFNATGTYATSAYSGSLGFSATGGHLTPNPNFTARITNGNDPAKAAVSGSLDLLRGVFDLTLTDLKVEREGLFVVSAGTVGLHYDRSRRDRQQLVSISTGSLTLTAFQNHPELTLNGVAIFNDGFTIENFSGSVGELRLGSFLTAQSSTISGNSLRVFTNQAPTGSFTFSTGAAQILPGVRDLTCKLDDLNNDGTALVGTITLNESGSDDFSVVTEHATFSIANTFSVSFTGAAFDPFADVMLSVAAQDVTVASLGLGGTITGLEVLRDGTFSASGVALNITDATAAKLALGGIIPLRLHQIGFKFLGDANGNGVRDAGETFSLREFELTVTGRFNFDELNKLPFSPVIRLSDPTKAYAAEDDVTIGLRNSNGTLTPWDLPSITLGIENLSIGSLVTFAGEITLGGYVNGAWTGQVGGYLLLKHNDRLHDVRAGTNAQPNDALASASPEGFRIDIADTSVLDVATGTLRIAATTTISFSLEGHLSVTDLRLAFALEFSFNRGTHTLSVGPWGLQQGSFEAAQLNLKNWLKIDVTGGMFNFHAAAGEHLVHFESATANMSEWGISGAVGSLALDHVGRPIAEKGFHVDFKVEPRFFSKVTWPSWLPIHAGALSMRVAWADMNADPAAFDVLVSGSMEANVPDTQLGIGGSLAGLEFSIHDGTPHLERLTDLRLHISGKLADMLLEGDIEIGMMRFDAAGTVLDKDDVTTPVDKRVIYGLVDAGFELAGYGLRFRVGLSDYGPISAFAYLGAPIPIGAETGFALQSLYGFIQFGKSPLGVVTEATQLEHLTLAIDQTAPQWEAACIESIRDIVTGRKPGENVLADLVTNFWIEGGVTLYNLATEDTITLTAAFRLDTAGRMLAVGRLNVTQEAHLEAKVFLDLSRAGKAGHSGALMIFADVPTSLVKSPVTVFGDLKASVQDHTVSVHGGLRLSADGVVNTEIDGSATFRILASNRYELEIDGTTSFTGFNHFLGIDGKLKVDVVGKDEQQIYGGVLLKPDEHNKFADSVGLDVKGHVVWRFNFTTHDATIELHVPGGTTEQFDLPKSSISTLVEGTFGFAKLGDGSPRFTGNASLYQGNDWLAMVVDADVVLGPSDTGLRFDALGYLRLELAGIAGELQLSGKGTFKEVSASGDLLLRVNTTAKRIQYTTPTEYGNARQIDLPEAPPEILGRPQAGASAWAYVSAENGELLLGSTARITGDFALVASGNKIEVRLGRDSVEGLLPARVEIGEAGHPLLSFTASGALTVDETGAIGALVADLSGASIASGSLKLNGQGHWLINTTATAQVIDGLAVPVGAGGDPYSELLVSGDLVLEKPTKDFVTLAGTHSLKLVSKRTGPGYHLALSSQSTLTVSAAGEALITAQFGGAGYVDETGLAAFFTLRHDSPPGLLGLAKDFSSFSLGLNTTADTLAVTRVDDAYVFTVVPASTQPDQSRLAILPSLVGAQLNARGEMVLLESFVLAGDWVFTVDDNIWTMDVDGEFRLLAPPLAAAAGVAHKTIFTASFKDSIRLTLPGVTVQKDFGIGSLKLPGLDISGAVSLLVNTTKSEFGGVTGPYARLSVAGTSFRVAGFELSGDLHLEQKAASSLTAAGDFAAKLEVAGATLLSSHAHGEFHVGFDGLAGALVLDKPVIPGLEFQSDDQAKEDFFQLRFNTSSSAFKIGDDIVLPAGPYAIAHIHATLTFASFQPLVLQGDFDLDADGQLHVDASLKAYLLSRSIDPNPLVTLQVTGALTHSTEATTGRLSLKAGSSQAGLDLPQSWGISFGRQDQEFSVEFNLLHGAQPPDSGNDGATDPTTVPADGVRITFENRMTVGFQDINATFHFTWVRGKEFFILLDGSTFLGFGARDSEGRPAEVLIGADIGGVLKVVNGGLLAGLEASFAAGSRQPKLMTELGLNWGADAEAKLLVLINTTGKDANFGELPPELRHFSKDEKFALLVDGTLKISSLEFEGMFGFTLFNDGFKLQVSAIQNLSLSEGGQATLTLAKSIVAGSIEVRGGEHKGVVGFLAADVTIADVEIAGFALLKDEIDGYVRINTSGKAVNMADAAHLPALAEHFDRSLLQMPAGNYAQLILDADWTSPPFFGIRFRDWLVIEIADDAFVLSGQMSVKAELFAIGGTSQELFDVKATIAAIITKDRHFALAGEIEGDPLGSLHSGFLKTDAGSSQKAILQLKTMEEAVDLNRYIPSGLGADPALYRFEKGLYAKVITESKLDMVTLGVGVTMTGATTLEFKSEPDKHRMWVEAEIFGESETKLSVLGTIKEQATVALYVGSDGIAFVFDREADKGSALLRSAEYDFKLSTLKLSLNTTGRAIPLGPTSAAADHVALHVNGGFQFGLFALTGDYAFKAAVSSAPHLDITSAAALTFADSPLARTGVSGSLSASHFNLQATGAVALGLPSIAHLDGNVTVGLDSQHGFSGLLAGDVHLLGKPVQQVSEQFAVTGIDVPFSAVVDVPLPGALDYVAVSGHLSGRITTHGIRVNEGSKVSVRVHNTVVDQLAFALDSAAGTWSLSGTSAVQSALNIGPAHVSVALTFGFDVAHANGATKGGVTVDGTASASVSGHSPVTVHSGRISLGQGTTRIAFPIKISVQKFHVHVTLFQHTVTVDLNRSSLIQGSDLAGSVVFLDTNGNRQQDDHEISARADERGYFSFDTDAFPGALGALSPFDTDRNGRIDSSEGVFVIQGGTDLNSGLENPLQYSFAAGEYGTFIQPVYSPLVHLHADLVRNENVSSDEAWKKLHVAFGIPSWVGLPYFDHNADESYFPDSGAYHEVEAAYAQVNAFLINAGTVLRSLLPDLGVEEIQSSLTRQLAHAIAQQDTSAYDEAISRFGSYENASPAGDLLEAAFVRQLIDASIVDLSGGAVRSEWSDLVRATAHVVAEQSRMIELLRVAEADDFTRTLALVKAEAQHGSSAQLLRVAGGELSAAAVINGYGHDEILNALETAGFDAKSTAAAVGRVSDFTGTRAELTPLMIPVVRLEGGLDRLTWRVETSNHDLLAPDRVQVLQEGGQWVVRLNPDAAHSGLAAITLHATDEHGNESGASTFIVDVVPTIRVTSVVPEVTRDAAHLAVTITLDAPSNQAVSGRYAVAGTAVEGVHFTGGTGMFTLDAGSTSTTFRIPLLGTPYGAPVTTTIVLDELVNAAADNAAPQAQFGIPAIPSARLGQRVGRGAAFTTPALAAADGELLRNEPPGSHHPDAGRISPDKMTYRE